MTSSSKLSSLIDPTIIFRKDRLKGILKIARLNYRKGYDKTSLRRALAGFKIIKAEEYSKAIRLLPLIVL